ncbi:CYTH and CHAD domain-containing protein [Geodermatophilus sabuli]|uniref:CHAD domain-containing protein n=1 Tax=Geodermatophilus sabuli TaxID=1564158 RepID=A0A285EEP3_9ACTN|nr:CYTH and CHAD domain-containing protein [Geodermatophilus sabuli]MBB3086315.1 CHAD domain-containing protein [Geodermatophilus sabuli]SNX97470.1 CHAD domain-containing protein [Geodermatophilus sabuli]
MTTEHLEIERKFEAEESFALPDLAGVGEVASMGEPQTHELEATYYDTADLRLLRSRVTLRRRTGGPDAGWHVKLPAGAGARRELHQPLGRASRTVPKAVLAPVLGQLGTAAPAPVATLSTRRVVHPLLDGEGRVLAEVAEDVVHGTALAAVPGEPATVTIWREVEVELVDGDAALLDAVTERLVDAGARVSASPSKVGRVLDGRLPAPATAPGAGADGGPAGNGKKGKRREKKGGAGAKADPASGAGAVVVAALAGQLTALRAADLAVRTGQEDGVHDVRVACRRLRSILAAFRPVLDREQTDPLREELRWVGEQLSGARDGEVALAHLRALVAEQPPELVLGPVAARLQQTAVSDHEAGARAVTRALADRRYLRLLDALDALLADPPLTAAAGDPAPAVVADAVRRAGRRLRRAVAAAQAAEGEEREHALHAVRKAAKRVRYTAEVAAGLLGTPAEDLVADMQRVQDALGTVQDTVITRAYCTRLGLLAFAAGENAWSFGRLHGLEEARAARATDAFWALEPSLRKAVRAASRAG